MVTHPWVEQHGYVGSSQVIDDYCRPSSSSMIRGNHSCEVLPEHLGRRPYLFYDLVPCPAAACWWDEAMFRTDLCVILFVLVWCMVCYCSMSYQHHAHMLALTEHSLQIGPHGAYYPIPYSESRLHPQ